MIWKYCVNNEDLEGSRKGAATIHEQLKHSGAKAARKWSLMLLRVDKESGVPDMPKQDGDCGGVIRSQTPHSRVMYIEPTLVDRFAQWALMRL